MQPSQAGSAPFRFPRDYHFPPFFTRQTNLTTYHAQLTKWSALVLAYCQHYRIFKLSLSGQPLATTTTTATTSSSSSAAAAAAAAASPKMPATDELFHNRKLDKRLSLADIRAVVDFMRKEGRAEYVGGASGGDLVWVYWRTPEEWAAVLEGWVEETAQKGSVLTLYELTEGDNTRGTEFHGLDPEILQRALGVLVKRGKAQIFGEEDSQGVKFF